MSNSELAKTLLVIIKSTAGIALPQLQPILGMLDALENDRLLRNLEDSVDAFNRRLQRERRRNANRLQELEAQVEVQEDRFRELVDLLLDWKRVLVGTSNKERIRAAAGIVGSGFGDADLDTERARFLLRLLESLSDGSLRVLGGICRRGAGDPNAPMREAATTLAFNQLQSHLRSEGADYEDEYLHALLKQLSQFNLIELREPPTVSGPNQSGKIIQVTRFGVEFTSFLEDVDGGDPEVSGGG